MQLKPTLPLFLPPSPEKGYSRFQCIFKLLRSFKTSPWKNIFASCFMLFHSQSPLGLSLLMQFTYFNYCITFHCTQTTISLPIFQLSCSEPCEDFASTNRRLTTCCIGGQPAHVQKQSLEREGLEVVRFSRSQECSNHLHPTNDVTVRCCPTAPPCLVFGGFKVSASLTRTLLFSFRLKNASWACNPGEVRPLGAPPVVSAQIFVLLLSLISTGNEFPIFSFSNVCIKCEASCQLLL